jgi:hypothetical protein
MICYKCGKSFPDKDIHESHDVPCYLFYDKIDRKDKKNEADKHGRHWLHNNCENGCHKKYERELNKFLIEQAKIFAKRWFNG